jgi:hypothetical protein
VSAPNRSFFSGLHLLITGLAALVTASVAVFGVAVNQGWLGSKSTTSGAGPGASSGSTATGSTSTTSAPGTPGASDTTAGAGPQYAVDPLSVTFTSLGPTTAAVKVSNTGLVPMTVEQPMFSAGSDTSHFSANAGTCGVGSVDPGLSCQLQVTFKHAPGTFTATLDVRVTGAVRATEVSIQATAIL